MACFCVLSCSTNDSPELLEPEHSPPHVQIESAARVLAASPEELLQLYEQAFEIGDRGLLSDLMDRRFKYRWLSSCNPACWDSRESDYADEMRALGNMMDPQYAPGGNTFLTVTERQFSFTISNVTYLEGGRIEVEAYLNYLCMCGPENGFTVLVHASLLMAEGRDGGLRLLEIFDQFRGPRGASCWSEFKCWYME